MKIISKITIYDENGVIIVEKGNVYDAVISIEYVSGNPLYWYMVLLGGNQSVKIPKSKAETIEDIRDKKINNLLNN